MRPPCGERVDDLDVLSELAWRAARTHWPGGHEEPGAGRSLDDLAPLARARRLEREAAWGRGPAPP